MFEDAAVAQIESRIDDLQSQRKHAGERIRRTIDGLLHNEQARLTQYRRLHEIRNVDGE